jgi:pimeloyl-ACP methyl ester carboxylesterase
LAGHLDAEHIGFIGTSKGGFIGLALYQAGMIDPRIDAILPKIATAPDGTYDWAAGPPLLMINGTADTSAPYEDAVQNYADASPPKGLVTLEGVDHTLTVGSGVLIEGPLGFFGYFLKGQANGLDRIAAGVATEPVASLQADWGI